MVSKKKPLFFIWAENASIQTKNCVAALSMTASVDLALQYGKCGHPLHNIYRFTSNKRQKLTERLHAGEEPQQERTIPDNSQPLDHRLNMLLICDTANPVLNHQHL